MPVTDYILLSRSDRERLAERLGVVVAKWQREWCVESSRACHVEVVERVPAVPIVWDTAVNDKERLVSLGLDAPNGAGFVSMLVGAPCSGAEDGLAAELKQQALRAMGAVLCVDSALSNSPRPSVWSDEPLPEIEHTRDVVAVRCVLDQSEFWIVLHPRLTNAYLQRSRTKSNASSPLASVRNAVASQPAKLEVLVGTAELPLPELATLAVGDVIKLDRRLEEPVLVKLGPGAPLCAGYLGTQGKHKAVQLAPLPDRKEA